MSEMVGEFTVPSKMAAKYYPHVDGLRALAVMSVIMSHLDFKLFQGGFVGVDVFFVISGFLVTNIITNELALTDRFSFLNFYARRMRRILPALLFTIILSFLCAIYLLNLAKFIVFGGSVSTAAFYTSNIFFNRHSGYFDIFSQSNPLLHTWSLGVEEQFYLFWPMLLLVGHWLFRKETLVVVVFVFIISLGMNIENQEKHLNSLYYLGQYRAFEFCIGATLVWLIKNQPTKNISAEILCLCGLILILGSIVKFNSNTLFPSYNALFPAIGAFLVIYAGSARVVGYIFSNAVSRYIGLISYSLYLIHWPLIIFAKTYNEDIGDTFQISSVAKIMIFFLAIIIASLMYYLIEQPFRRNIPRAPKKQLKLVVNWMALSLMACLLGSSAYFSRGWLWRANSPQIATDIKDIATYNAENWGGAGFQGGYVYNGASNYPNLVMMGDSHSGMLDIGIVDEVAKPNNLTVYTVSGGGAGNYESSLMLPGITRLGKYQAAFDNSDRTAIVDAVGALQKSPNSVLLYSASYSSQINLAGFLETHKSLGIDTERTNKYEDYKPIVDALDKLHKDIDGRSLVIIGDFPGASFDVVNCASQLKWFSKHECQLKDEISRNKAALNVNLVLSKYSENHKNVYFIDPYRVFCKEGYCANVDSHGNPYYSDGQHLTVFGSRFFVDNIKSKLISIYLDRNNS